jgi:hypothetical protein
MPKRRLLFYPVIDAAVLAVAITCIPAFTEIAQAETRDAPSELRSRAKAYEHDWNTHRGSAVAAFFTEDADMILGNGPRIVGRGAIQE